MSIKGKEWVPAVVTAKASTPRSFIVTTPNGQQYRRNRRHLIKTEEEPPKFTLPMDLQEPELEVTTETPTFPSQMVPTPQGDNQNQPESILRRSSRTRRQPAWFNDYHMNK